MAYIGIDIGSESVRVSIISNDTQIYTTQKKISIYISHIDNHYVTQDSEQIWMAVKESIKECIDRAKGLTNNNDLSINGIACCATCSMVVMKLNKTRDRSGKSIYLPYPMDYDYSIPNQNVIMWMDSRSIKESQDLQTVIQELSYSSEFISRLQKCFSSGMSPELALPKLKHLSDHVADPTDLIVFDLHDYISFMLSTNNSTDSLDYMEQIRIDQYSCNLNEIGIDGSLCGWSKEFFNAIGLNRISVHNPTSQFKDNNDIPLFYPGAKIGTVCPELIKYWGIQKDTKISIGNGVIDCYGACFSTNPSSLESTPLYVIAGTSTCFLVSSDVPVEAPTGVWGPFASIEQGKYYYEGGLSCSGLLFQNLFETHKGFEYFSNDDTSSPFDIIDMYIENQVSQLKLTHEYQLNFDKFYYGDLLGNRTPYNNPYMSGMYLGERVVNNHQQDFIQRYLCIIEYLALQTQLFIEQMNHQGVKINEIIISGSQAKNLRLARLINIITGLKVKLASQGQGSHAVVTGAAVLAARSCQGNEHFQIGDDDTSGVIVSLDLSLEKNQSIKKLMIKKRKIIDKMVQVQLDAITEMSEYR